MQNLSLKQTVQLLFLVTNAMLDAGVGAWHAKRLYDSARPMLVSEATSRPPVLPYMTGHFTAALCQPLFAAQPARGAVVDPGYCTTGS
jgi:hypothetical protein